MKLIFAVIVLSASFVLQTEPTTVQIESPDGQVLLADYYAPTSGGAPAVLLIHQLYTDGTSWSDFVPHLQANGYAVLVPDLRGYGRTGGAINWQVAQQDTVLWLNWLRDQPNIDGDKIATVGSSMGANLAVIGCADLKTQTGVGCLTSVAVSPGLNYFGYTPLAPALAGGMANCPTLFLSSQRDGYPARAVRELTGEYPIITPRWYAGNAHGMALLDADAMDEVIAWLNMHRGGSAC